MLFLLFDRCWRQPLFTDADAPTMISLSKARLDMPFSVKTSEVLAFINCKLIVILPSNDPS